MFTVGLLKKGLPKIIKCITPIRVYIHFVKFQGVLLYSHIIHMIVGCNFHSVLHHLIIIGDAAILDD